MDIENIEFAVSKKLSSFLEEKYGKNPMFDGNWVDVEKFVENEISPLYNQKIDDSEIDGLEDTINGLESDKEELEENISELSESSYSCVNSAADFLEKEILPKLTESDAEKMKEKIKELRSEADNFRFWDC